MSTLSSAMGAAAALAGAKAAPDRSADASLLRALYAITLLARRPSEQTERRRARCRRSCGSCPWSARRRRTRLWARSHQPGEQAPLPELDAVPEEARRAAPWARWCAAAVSECGSAMQNGR